MWCSACENELGDPQKELHDPQGEFLSDIGVIENPDDHHIKAIYGEKGMRLQCSDTGKMTKLLKEPPSKGNGKEQKGETGGPSDGGQQEQKPQPQQGKVYKEEREKTAESLLKEVITNPAYDLSDAQKREVDDWAEIYDYQIPPNTLEDVLKNLNGISKQKANLMRQKYEAKLNKWMKESRETDAGGAIGHSVPPPKANGANTQIRNKPSPEQPPEREANQMASQEPQIPEPGPRPKGRREEVVDKFAEKLADNVANDVGRAYSDIREIAVTVLKRKAERDPDWFLEKADEFGMDFLDELSQPSQAKQQREQPGQQSQPEADMEIDQALESVMKEEQSEPEPEPEPPNQREVSNMQQSPPVEPEENSDGQMSEEEREFLETFGGEM